MEQDKVIITIGDLLDFLKIDISNIESLPICHTLTMKQMRQVADDKELKAKYDKINKKDLIFFFYGKAPYMPKKYINNNIQSKNLPLTLIYQMDSVKHLKIHFNCFDSGGFKKYKIDTVNKNHFRIENCSIEVIKRYIKYFYGNNRNYLNMDPYDKDDENEFPFCGALEELNKIISKIKNRQEDLPYGEHVLTCEIQVEVNALKLNPERVVLPDSYITSPITRKQFQLVFGNAEFDGYHDKKVLESFKIYNNMSETVKNTIEEKWL